MPAGWVNTATNRLVVATLDGEKVLHKEPLVYEEVKLATRSYK